MIHSLTIVMYHYVRDVEQTRFPAIKARSVAAFLGQLDYIRRHYQVVSPADLAAAIRDPSAPLPPGAALLTFDDGYSDHYRTVFPLLVDRRMTGVFAPVGKAVLEGNVLDVNKIHFLLAAMHDQIGRLVDELFGLMDQHRGTYPLEANQAYWDRLAQPNRFDPAEIIFLKRMLQRDLPEDLRRLLTAELFRRHVTADEKAFAGDLYMDLAQLRELSRSGMGIASHGYDHEWLACLDTKSQAEQIHKSLDFLDQCTDTRRGWMFTYPYGSHNPDLLALSRQSGCIAGFTTEVAIATGRHDPLQLPRLDTNDLPTTADAAPNDWTRQAMQNVS